ncbi:MULTISPECIES: SusC/RagA family TonB-linked outer membrane protein [Aestuariibaculum]|uniref:TonB-dependent receptor n=1 Tax=Aestuariibaculum lutulentum TaxID=2920935 RepID=A0ABS9RJE7_9FLAO|nr:MULTISPECIES: TonB-dependent receptor [Aestuariibaculum]MCH4553086.1 TonB-dependent receptor [Aestuariibaculum lutulentum]MCR8668982.1 TonB-dependent receptor [Aestuariibaculum sp. M13]
MNEKRCFHGFKPCLQKVTKANWLTVILILMSVCATFALEQQKSISGTVVDGAGMPVPGVTIIVKGTSNGTATDFDGQYTISDVKEGDILLFSYVGMKQQEVTVAGTSTINVTMEEDTAQLDEVVVVGFGTQKKTTLTGAVSSVKGKELKSIPVTNVSQGLSGRLPGVVAVSNGGEPGYDGVSILIRGVNTFGNASPLIVVDGVPGRSLERIDPSTIESMSVLKDASAAIYGAQAANGVILITTKRGTPGKPKIDFTTNYGLTRPTVMPELTNSAEYATLLNEIDLYAGRGPRYSPDEIQKFRDGSDPWNYPNSDYIKETLKPWSAQTYNNLSISGGTENTKYFVSLSSKSQDAFYRNSSTKFEQYDMRSNLDIKINDYINFRMNTSGRYEDRNFPQRGAPEIFNKLMRSKPIIPAYWPNGLPGPGMEGGDNPVVLVTDDTGYSKDRWYVLNSDFQLNIDIPGVKGLSVNLNASLDKSFNFVKNWSTPWTVYSWDNVSYDDNGDPLLVGSEQGLDDPRLRQSARDNQNILTRGMINYESSFSDDHSLKLMGGVERIEGKGSDFWAFRRNFVSTAVDQLFAGGLEDINNGGSAYEETRLNYFGRANYGYKDKYLAEFVWRYQASYIFEQSSRYGFFPGVSLGYVISKEGFWQKNIPFINFAKFRASWGQTGNDLISPYQYLSSYSFGGLSFVSNGGTQFNKVLYEGVVPNTGVTWESATQKDVGVDLHFFDGKLTLTADYFENTRTDILARRNASVPNSTGLSLPDENIGEFENKGFDFNVVYSNNSSAFTYSVGVNGVYAKNKVLFWDEPPGAPVYQQSTGRPLGASLYYNAIGIFQNQDEIDAYPHLAGARPGDIIFEDYNEDGVLDGKDMVRYDKSRTPLFTGGLNMNFGFKGFDLNLLFQGALGGVFYQGTESGEFGNYLKSFYDNRWTELDPSTEHPRTYNRTGEYWVNQPNTYWLHKTDYVRLKTIELGYSLPKSVTDKIKIDNLRMYVNGFNLWTHSPDMKDFDPEMVQTGYAGYSYPLNKAINLGLNVTF